MMAFNVVFDLPVDLEYRLTMFLAHLLCSPVVSIVEAMMTLYYSRYVANTGSFLAGQPHQECECSHGGLFVSLPDTKTLGANVHYRYIYGGHVIAYMKMQMKLAQSNDIISTTIGGKNGEPKQSAENPVIIFATRALGIVDIRTV
ncbi:hypothetical protein Tco_1189209, partial [Tanacetum coccineum]